ncbi:MAG: DNA gyrase/topoisomerase IV subunit A [Lentimicrobiaceae bacterium]|nr:DNA gyrase/topoisomerase IV subunit A [Lentimicrobiaceae bacterium]
MEDNKDKDIELEGQNELEESGVRVQSGDGFRVIPLKGLIDSWFIDYASSVILDRAVPEINDGFKPVQRRILHSMKELEDGRYNKVANIVGNTMKYHPHGDASIGDALVNLGQKELLIDTQGNWGNVLTGDPAAAPRYIEARLSKFALDVIYNPKTTEWKFSYDGRNKEPVTLPVKFPLLLAQGAMGIAVGLKCEILPHNFNELIDASIAYLRDEPFVLYPDFRTGGMIDVRSYNDGSRGCKVQVRAKITQLDKKTLVITEIPYGTTTGTLIESITKAGEKGQIKIRRVDDNTSRNAEIVIHLASGVSPDQTIDALYAFTQCQVSLNSLCTCVIRNEHPEFTTISAILKDSTDRTLDLLSWELKIKLDELERDWHWISLEKIFFEKRIYKILEKDADTWDDQITAIERAFDPYRVMLKAEITRDDVLRLCEKPVRKISKFDIKKAEEQILDIENQIEKVRYDLDHIVDYTINFYKEIKRKHGKGRERRTEIRNFDNISAVAVAANNEKLYVNKEESFICTSAGLKKEQNKDAYTFVSDCSDLDDIIVFRENGTFMVTKLQAKCFVGPDKIIHADIFHKNDDRTVYNMVYRSGKAGSPYYVKRFSVKGITHDKDYDLTMGESGSKVIYFSANPNGEAEVIKVMLRPQPKLKKTSFDYNFADLMIKGRGSRGNRLTIHPINKIVKRDDGVSTLAAREIWYDDTVKRLNADKRGILIGEFSGDDKILQIYSNGEFRLTGYDLSTHFDDDMTQIMKFDPNVIFSVIYIEGDSKLMYIKRFMIEEDCQLNRRISFIGDNKDAEYLFMNMDRLPRLLLSFNDSPSGKQYEDEELNVAEYIGIKSYKAKGKRLSTHNVATYTFLDPYEPQDEGIDDIEEDKLDIEENITEEITSYNNESDDNFFSEDDGMQLTLFE